MRAASTFLGGYMQKLRSLGLYETFMHLANQETGAYTVITYFRIANSVNLSRMQKALLETVTKHQIFFIKMSGCALYSVNDCQNTLYLHTDALSESSFMTMVGQQKGNLVRLIAAPSIELCGYHVALIGPHALFDALSAAYIIDHLLKCLDGQEGDKIHPIHPPIEKLASNRISMLRFLFDRVKFKTKNKLFQTTYIEHKGNLSPSKRDTTIPNRTHQSSRITGTFVTREIRGI